MRRSRTGTVAWRRLRLKIIERDGWRCRKCGRPGQLHVHHLQPVHLGGSDAPENLVTWCRSCHGKFHARPKPKGSREWDRYLGGSNEAPPGNP